MSTAPKRRTRHRGNNEGSIYQRKSDGLWVGAISLGYDGEGKPRRRTVYGKTKREAQEKMSALMDKHRLGHNIEVNRITVGQFFEGWLREKERKLRPNTMSKYRNHVENHISPELGRIRLTDLNYSHINAFFDTLAEKTNKDGTRRLSNTTQSNIAGILSMGLNDAVRKRIIHENPVHAVERPQEDEEPPRFMDADEWAAWRAAADGERLVWLYELGFHTGLRPSELLGLPWRNVDLDKRLIKVDQALHEDGAAIWMGPLKTDTSYRTISIGEEAILTIKRQRAQYSEMKLKAGSRWSPPRVDRQYSNDLVFTTSTGDWLRRNVIYKHDLRRVRERSGLHDVGLHTLRHTHAAVLIHMGARPLDIQQRFGHKDVAFTLKRYGHLFPKSDERTAELMDEFERQQRRLRVAKM